MHEVIKERKKNGKQDGVQTTMKARKISAGSPADLATISRIEIIIPVICPFLSFRGPDNSEVLS